jgi:hypothetical protein
MRWAKMESLTMSVLVLSMLATDASAAKVVKTETVQLPRQHTILLYEEVRWEQEERLLRDLHVYRKKAKK